MLDQLNQSIKTETTTTKLSLRMVVYIAVIFNLVLFFIIAHDMYELQIKQRRTQNSTQNQKVNTNVLGIESQKEMQGLSAQQNIPIIRPGLPVRLIIPSIQVAANVEHMDLSDEGEMNVPSNTMNVGWYKDGPSPGETGSAVISGHLDGTEGSFGVFSKLHTLKMGDKIFVTNDLGATSTFEVRESRIYSPGYADEVFLSNDTGTHLNLITCDGVWNGASKSYTKRLVVFTDRLLF